MISGGVDSSFLDTKWPIPNTNVNLFGKFFARFGLLQQKSGFRI
jgi:hypothetical protein